MGTGIVLSAFKHTKIVNIDQAREWCWGRGSQNFYTEEFEGGSLVGSGMLLKPSLHCNCLILNLT